MIRVMESSVSSCKRPLKKRPLRLSQPDMGNNNENGELTMDEDIEFSFPLRSIPTVWNLCSDEITTKKNDLNNSPYNAVTMFEQARKLSISSQYEMFMESSSPLRRSTTFMNLPMMTCLSSWNVVDFSAHNLEDMKMANKRGSWEETSDNNNCRSSVIRHGKNTGDYEYDAKEENFSVIHRHNHSIWTLDVPNYSTMTKQINNQFPFCLKYNSRQNGGQGQGTSLQRPFSCNSCEKSYKSSFALKMHTQTHTLPFKCLICDRGFSRPWLLQGHVRTHTGEKPFSCPFSHCLRCFADRSNLRAHVQTHAKVKKYLCSTCPKSYSRMSLLVKHKESCG